MTDVRFDGVHNLCDRDVSIRSYKYSSSVTLDVYMKLLSLSNPDHSSKRRLAAG